ncbi:MAG: dUTP diphosphatase [Spirochaetales bacterium]|nr:dUTP diphosphatase [Spirochaetales bacterium]
MQTLTVPILTGGERYVPRYASAQAAGADLKACLPDGPVTLKPLCRVMVPTGVSIQLPVGFEAQVRPRSGLAARSGVTVLNTPGTIDSDYRGEIRVILVNLSSEPFTISDGDRIAQLVISRHERAEFTAVPSLDDTDRGEGGFGSTGIKS